MDDNLSKSLDEILDSEKRIGSSRPRHNLNRRQDRDRRDFPRDGVRKSYRHDRRNIDTEWVHDMFDANSNHGRPGRRERDSPDASDSRPTKLRVENIHWKLTLEDLKELFTRIGPIVKLDLEYDRSGRSEGTAYVVYENHGDAKAAISEYDGANANGQPICITELPSSRRDPLDYAARPGRSLAERITAPRNRSRSPPRYSQVDAVRKGIDRYVPGQGGRSHSPNRRRGQTGRRPGARRDAPPRDVEGGRGGKPGRESRSRKTQEELDAEMDDYFGGDHKVAEAGPLTDPVSTTIVEDVDMNE